MCGFVGFFPSINEGTDKNYLYKMLSPINHRGPDSTDIFRNKNIAMGHHRLSIIDLKGGNQPLVDQSSGDCLVFNGEIYGYKNHAENLRKKGISLKDNSDTEVLFKLIINYMECLPLFTTKHLIILFGLQEIGLEKNRYIILNIIISSYLDQK